MITTPRGERQRRGGGAWLGACFKSDEMRTFFGLVAAVAVVAGVLKYREGQQPAPAEQSVRTPAASAQPAAAATPRHFPKRALDRAADVKRQVAKEQADRDAN